VPDDPKTDRVVPPWATGRRRFSMLAYLDAASGSLIIQAVVAGAAGVAVFFKLGWRRLTSPFRSKRSTGAEATARTPAEVGDHPEA
jgi:hypothetical protein